MTEPSPTLLPCHECNGTGLIGRKVGARYQCNLCEGEGKFADRRAPAAVAPDVERVAPEGPRPCRRCGCAPYLHETDWTEPPTWTCYCFCVTEGYETREQAIAAWNAYQAALAQPPSAVEDQGQVKRLIDALYHIPTSEEWQASAILEAAARLFRFCATETSEDIAAFNGEAYKEFRAWNDRRLAASQPATPAGADRCCLKLSPEECSQVPSRICAGLDSVSEVERLAEALQTALSLYGDGFANDVRDLCRSALARGRRDEESKA